MYQVKFNKYFLLNQYPAENSDLIHHLPTTSKNKGNKVDVPSQLLQMGIV